MKLLHALATNSDCSLPPCGGGLGRGVHRGTTASRLATTPTPNPSPQGGGERQSAHVSRRLRARLIQLQNASPAAVHSLALRVGLLAEALELAVLELDSCLRRSKRDEADLDLGGKIVVVFPVRSDLPE